MAKKIPQKHGGAINRYEKGDKVSNNVGRKKSRIKQWNEQHPEEGISDEDVKRSYTILPDKTENELKKITTNKEEPMVLRICAKKILENRGFETIEVMLDRAHGKPKQTNETDLNINNFAEFITDAYESIKNDRGTKK